MLRALAVVAVSVVIASTAGRAAAQTGNATAAELRRQGLELYSKGDYDKASDRFEASFELDPRNEVLFAWAQSERLGGDCAKAIGLYEKFIASGPRPKQRKVAAALLALCRETAGSQNGNKRPADDEPADPEPGPAEPSPRDEGTSPGGSWTRDWVGHALAGGGAVAVGVGIGFLVKSSSAIDGTRDASSYPDYSDRLDRAKLYRTVGIAGCAVGGALVVTAIIHYVRFAPADSDTTVTATLGDDGIGFAVLGRF